MQFLGFYGLGIYTKRHFHSRGDASHQWDGITTAIRLSLGQNDQNAQTYQLEPVYPRSVG